MEIDIRHIAKLARLHIDEEQLPRFQKEMEGIIQMVNGMKTPDPANAMVMREDVVQPSFPRDQLLANAPQTEAGCVVVPRTVE